MRTLRLSELCIVFVVTAEAASGGAEDYFRAIRANELQTLRELAKSGPSVVRDRLDWTPLHYAAVYGSTDAVRILLEAGSDPNAVNTSKATPVMYGAYSLEKTRLLVAKGGNVNAKSSDGSTPLWVAIGVPGNDATVRWLLEHGADAKYKRGDADDYLTRATATLEPDTLRLLIEKGADARYQHPSGFTALLRAVDSCDGGARAKILMGASAETDTPIRDTPVVKNGPLEFAGATPLMDAAACGDPANTAALLAAGAQVNARDVRKMTPLMMAVAVDHANPAVVKMLIRAGAELNTPDRFGETALDWAERFRNPAVLEILKNAGAKGKGLHPAPVRPDDYKPDAKTAIERASTLLAKSSQDFFREGGGCVGCHHQPFAGRVFGAVKAAGLEANGKLRQLLLDGMVVEGARAMNDLPLINPGGGGYQAYTYPLAGMAEMGEPTSALTDAMVHFIAESQSPDGSWTELTTRAPLGESSITRTMMAISAMKTYGWPARQAELDARIARARKWLLTAPGLTTVEEADRLTGLWLAGAAKPDLRKVAAKLLSAQRADGGWAQTPHFDSDAYGTGVAMYSLRKAGMLKAPDKTYQRGAAFLLNTQFPDGSWYVRSRAVKFQPYFESGFPFGHDQWISYPATAYAVMALAPVAGK